MSLYFTFFYLSIRWFRKDYALSGLVSRHDEPYSLMLCHSRKGSGDREGFPTDRTQKGSVEGTRGLVDVINRCCSSIVGIFHVQSITYLSLC